MTRTENINLGLWEGTDFPNYTMPNENMNTLDNIIHAEQIKTAQNTNAIENIESELTDLKNDVTSFESEQNEKNTDFSSKITENAQSIENIDGDVTTINTKINNQRDMIISHDRDITNIKSDLALVKSDVETTFKCTIDTTTSGGECIVSKKVSKIMPEWLTIDDDGHIHVKNDNDSYVIKFTGFVRVVSRTGILKSPLGGGVNATMQVTNDVNCLPFTHTRTSMFTSVSDSVTAPYWTIDNSTNNISLINCELEIMKVE